MPHPHTLRPMTLALLLVLADFLSVRAADRPPQFDLPSHPGSIVLVGGGAFPQQIQERFLQLAGGKNASLVIIPTADEKADTADQEAALTAWKKRGFTTVTWLHTRDRATADSPAFVEPLVKATAVWFEGGSQDRIAAAYVGTAFERELLAVLQRGGVIGGTSAGAAVMSRVMIERGNPVPDIGTGFDVVPGVIIDQHFSQRARQPRLINALGRHPGLVGLGIDEGTALIVRGRQLDVLGEGRVIVCITAGNGRAATQTVLKPGAPADLVGLRRAAYFRTLPPFPAEEVPVPEVSSGSLLIVGGGAMPKPLVDRFIELAGGPDALIIVLPTANPPTPVPSKEARFLEVAGAKRVKLLSATTQAEIESPEFLETVAQAGGVWFGGGRQWRFLDAYEGTKALPAFHAVLKRGGIIGGSSAGATIQGDLLVRGSPLGNTIMLAEGYERGFAFLPGTAIDQHFAQRKRFGDMSHVMAVHPQLLGIGLDEGTALLVRGHTAEILGQSNAHFFDRRKPLVAGEPDYETVGTGKKYDLKLRQVIEKGE